VKDVKICIKCHEEKPSNAFYVIRDSNLGKARIDSRCKRCHNAIRHRDLTAQIRRDPDCKKKVLARVAARHQVFAGKVGKPTHCGKCGRRFPRHHIHGHHHNGYDNPLDVIFICRWCHQVEDGRASKVS